MEGNTFLVSNGRITDYYPVRFGPNVGYSNSQYTQEGNRHTYLVIEPPIAVHITATSSPTQTRLPTTVHVTITSAGNTPPAAVHATATNGMPTTAHVAVTSTGTLRRRTTARMPKTRSHFQPCASHFPISGRDRLLANDKSPGV